MLFYTNIFVKGNNVFFRGFKDGKRVQQKIPFQPSFFVKSNNKKSDYKTLFGEPLERVKFSSIAEARDFIARYSDVSNFPIYGNQNYGYQFISKVFPDTIQFDMSLMKIVTIDIETTTEYGFPQARNPQEEILLITIQDYNTKEVTSFGCGPYNVKAGNVTYIKCQDEMDLLRRFIRTLKSDYPDIITGWNCQLFDIAYLSARILRVLGERALNECSPYSSVTSREITLAKGRQEIAYEWRGINILDYMDLYKKFSFKVLESYSLDSVAKEELNDEKIKHGYATFKEFYTRGWDKFVDYNIHDVVLVDKLEDKMKLLVLICTMAYDAKCNFVDIYSPVRTWDCILFNYLQRQNIIVHNPPAVDESLDRQIMGAFVRDPVPGKYDWVISFDATSLYPSIIMTWNMSPETLVDGEKYLADDDKSIIRLLERNVDIDNLLCKDYTMTANGQCFRRDKKGVFPELIEYYFNARQQAKRAMLVAQERYEKTRDESYVREITALNSKQMAAKILMNSLYGAMGNIFFRYYDIRIAEGITMTGQLIIRNVAENLNRYVNERCGTVNANYSFYSDTDSTYITLDELVRKEGKSSSSTKEIVDFLDKVCSTDIEPEINKTCQDIGNYLNVYADKIKFKREVIADRGIWIAKKRYALNVHNAEGVAYDPPKLKVLGMEIVRSSTPMPVRKALKETVSIALTKSEEEVREYVQKLEQRWNALRPEEIAFPRGVNGLDTYADSNSIFKKGTPMHVRGALIYNHLIDAKGLDKKYQKIREGDKIKFIYLREPNTIGSHVIAFLSDLPEEFSLHKFIDYDTMFEKSYIDPLTSLLNSIGWQVREQATLEDLFS